MRFRPRHYVLIVVILALGIYNFTRVRHQQPATGAMPKLSTPGTSPAWAVFDSAAKLRDAPDDQFQPALQSLNQSVDLNSATSASPQTPNTELADLHGCQTWLQFYRQEHLHPAINKPGWAEQLKSHVDSCAANHRDISQ